MTISFRYKNVKRPDGTTVKTPSIPVTLLGKESFDTVGLLDSGADISAIKEKDIGIAIMQLKNLELRQNESHLQQNLSGA